MKIAIIGAGNVGQSLATVWVRAGHEIVFGVRDAGSRKHRDLAESLGTKAAVASIPDATRQADVVVVATPWPAAQQALAAAGSLTGKVVIDCTNPLAADLSGLALGHTTSAAEQIARWAAGARVVKAFNTTGSGNMLDPRYGDQSATMFICGDDAAAKTLVTGLAESIGFEVIDAGPLTNARLLEPLAMLWIDLAMKRGCGRNIAFKLLRR